MQRWISAFLYQFTEKTKTQTWLNHSQRGIETGLSEKLGDGVFCLKLRADFLCCITRPSLQLIGILYRLSRECSCKASVLCFLVFVLFSPSSRLVTENPVRGDAAVFFLGLCGLAFRLCSTH